MRTDLPRVSVIIALYNEEKYISQAIDSILAQTYGDFELIIVDDGSKDRSGEIADLYSEKDSRISVFHTENRGVSSARNIGIENARGEWIMFLDGDDLYAPDAIEKLLRHSDGVDMVCGCARMFPSEKQYLEIKSSIYLKKLTDVASDFGFFFDQVTFLTCVWAKLYKRSKLTVLWDEDIPDVPDELWNIKNSLQFDGFRIIPDVIYNYRVRHAITLSTHFWTALLRTRVQVFEMWWGIFPESADIHVILLNELLSRTADWIEDLRRIDSIPDLYKEVMLAQELSCVTDALPEFDYTKLPAYTYKVRQAITQADMGNIFDTIARLNQSDTASPQIPS